MIPERREWLCPETLKPEDDLLRQYDCTWNCLSQARDENVTMVMFKESLLIFRTKLTRPDLQPSIDFDRPPLGIYDISVGSVHPPSRIPRSSFQELWLSDDTLITRIGTFWREQVLVQLIERYEGPFSPLPPILPFRLS